MAHKPHSLDYYIRDEEKAVEEYKRLALNLLNMGKRDLSDIVLNIADEENEHRRVLEIIRDMLKGEGK